LLGTPLVADLILKGEIEGVKEVMRKSENIGMKTFDTALFELYQEGLITEEEAIRNSDSANNVRLKIKFAKEDRHSSSGLEGFSLASLDDDNKGNFM
jgi:twitching motility protein PilU